MAEISCRQAELLAAEVEMGRATEAERMRVEVHLQGCESCATRTERLRALAGALRDEPVEARIPDRALVASAIMEAGAEDAARGRAARWWPVLAAAALLLAIAGGVAWWAGLGGGTRAPAVAGGSETERPEPRERGTTPQPDESDETAPPAALAGIASPCAGVRSEAAPETDAWVVTALGDLCRLRVTRGELRLFVEPDAGIDLVVQTPSAEVAVVGTVFSVGVEDGFTSVVVYRGTVEVSRDEDTVLRVTGGHQVDVGPDTETATVRAADRGALEPLERLAEEGRHPPAETVPDRPPAERSPDTAATPPAEAEGTGSGETAPEETDGTEAATAPAETEVDAAPVADLRRLLRQGQAAEARAQARERRTRPEYARRQAELWTVIAESYVMERDFRRAFDAYREVWSGSPGTATAANALIAGANLALDHLRNPAEAVRLYERYLRQYPRGALHETALIGRCRALAAAGRPREASACARAYLATHPHGRFRDRAERLLEQDRNP